MLAVPCRVPQNMIYLSGSSQGHKLVRGRGGEVEVTQVAPGYRIVPSSVTTHIKSLIIIIIRSYRVPIY